MKGIFVKTFLARLITWGWMKAKVQPSGCWVKELQVRSPTSLEGSSRNWTRAKRSLEVYRLHRGESDLTIWELNEKEDTLLNTSVSLQAREQECISEERLTSILLLVDQTWSDTLTFDKRSFFWSRLLTFLSWLLTFLKFAKEARQGDRRENVLIKNVRSIARHGLQSNDNVPRFVKLPLTTWFSRT